MVQPFKKTNRIIKGGVLLVN